VEQSWRDVGAMPASANPDAASAPTRVSPGRDDAEPDHGEDHQL
jgi:hypothetical protein